MISSSIDTEEKLALGRKILNFKLPFRKDLLYDNKITFGFEIEFCYARFLQVRDEIDEHNLTNWKAYNEPTVQVKDKYDRTRGGEVISPILRGKKPNWNELKKICDLIKFCLGEVNDKTAGHIHIGSQIFKNDKQKLTNFLLLWAIFEDTIKQFFYGEFIQGDFFNRLAPDCQEEFSVANYDFEKLQELRNNKSRDLKFYSVNFKDYKSPYEEKNNTVEFRAICGTLEPEIWQNNLNFLIHFIDWTNNITAKDLEIIKNQSFLNSHNQTENKFDKALFLANSIFTKEIDKMCFLKQYFKDFYQKDATIERVKLINH